jgi:tetratricopeptide (TPR) repeat protein
MPRTRRLHRLHTPTIAACAVALFCGRPARAAAQYVDFNVHVRESLRDLQARVARDTNDPVAYYNLAAGYWSKKQYDRADSTFRKAAAMDPEFALAHLAIALVQEPNKAHWQHLRRSGGDTALVQEVRYREREYTRAFMIDPFLDVRPLGMFPKGYERGYQDLEEARDFLAHRFRVQADSMPRWLLWLHALAAAHTGRLTAAVADVQALARVTRAWERSDSLSIAPLAVNNYLYMLAALLQRGGDRVDAIRLYQVVLGNDIGNYEAHVQLARIYEAQSDWPHALAERRAAVATFPENHRLLLDLGVTQYHASNLGDAEVTLHQAEEAGPRDPYVYYWLGMVHQARSDPDSARAEYSAFLRLAPSRDSAQIGEVRRKLAALP